MIALAQHQVRGDIASRPRGEERRRRGSELVEQVTEPDSLGGIEKGTGHTAGV